MSSNIPTPGQIFDAYETPQQERINEAVTELSEILMKHRHQFGEKGRIRIDAPYTWEYLIWERRTEFISIFRQHNWALRIWRKWDVLKMLLMLSTEPDVMMEFRPLQDKK